MLLGFMILDYGLRVHITVFERDLSLQKLSSDAYLVTLFTHHPVQSQ